MKFPTGGKSPRAKADLVKFRNRQYRPIRLKSGWERKHIYRIFALPLFTERFYIDRLIKIRKDKKYLMSRTKKLLLISCLSAMSTALMVITQIPMFIGFMKLDFSILPILIALYTLGLKSSLSILLLRSILKLLFFSEGISTIIGIPMNIIAISAFIMCIGHFQRKNSPFNLKKFILGGGFGTLLSTGIMIILNIIYALPLYEKFMNLHLEKMGMSTKELIITMVLPFNLMQGILFTISGSLLLVALLPIIHQCNRFN